MSVSESINKFLIGELGHLTEPTAKKSIGHNQDHGGGKHHHNNN